jgi:hypothetical protein
MHKCAKEGDMASFPDTSGMTIEQSRALINEWFADPLNKASYAAVEKTVEKLTNYHEPHSFMLADFNLLCGMVSDVLHEVMDKTRPHK